MAGSLMADDAHRVATRDRQTTADMVLSAAVKDAVRLVKLGRPGRAEFVLTRAGQSADRILGSERVQ